MVILKFKKTDTFDKKERILDRDCKITYKFNGLVNLQFRLFDDEVLHCEDRFECLGNRYVVKSIENYNVSCELDLNDFHTTFFTGKSKYNRLTLIEMLKKITNWEILNGQSKTFRRTLNIEDCSAFKVLFDIEKIFDVAFVFDCINKTIKVVDEPNKTNLIVSKDVNLESIDMTTDTYEHYTRLYAYGKDGLSFSEINDAKDYVEDFTYNSNVISAVFRDDRFTNKDNLKAKALELLKIHCKPITEFKVKVKDLGAGFLHSDNYYYAKDLKALSLHDEFYLENHLIKGRGIKDRLEKYRVIELVAFTGDPQANEVTVVNRGRSLNKMLAGIDEKITTDVLRKVNDEFSSRFDENRKELEKHFEDLRSSGHKIEENGTIYFVDKLPKEQAKNVLKIGVGGIMGSSNGFLGPYETAITNDGRVNLNKAMVGELDGHYIRANTVDFDKLTMEAREKLKNGLVTTEEFSKFKLDKDGFNQYIEQKVNEKGEVLKKYTSDFFAEREEVIKHEFNSSIDNKANSLKSEINSKANEINSNVDSKISNINKDVDSKIGNINKDVDSKIGEVNKSVDSKISDINSGIDSRIKSSDDKLRNEIGTSIGNIYDDLNKKNYELGQKQDKDIQSLRGDVDKRIDDNRRELNVKMNAMRHNFEEGAQDLYDFWKKSSDDINNELKNVDGKIAGAVNEMNGKAEKLSYDINKSAGNLRSEFNKNIDDKTGVLRSDINSNASKIDVNIKKIELIERDTKKFREFSSTIDEFKSKIGQIEKNKFEITTESKNLCAETGERKKGNDLFFNTSETLVAGKEYYILAEAHGVKKDDQWTKIFNANLKWLDFFDANYRNDSKILVNGLNVWKVSYDHDVTQVNIYPCGSGTYISKVRIYEASKSEDKKNLYVSHKISSDGSNEKLKTIEFKVSEKLQYGEIYAIEFNSEVQFKYYIINNDIYNTTYINNSATIMSGENGCYFEEKHQDGTFSVDMAVSMLEDSELKLYGDVKIYKSNIKNTTKSGFDVINEISSQIRQTQSEIDLTVKKNDVIHRINVSPEGTKIHGGAIVDVLEGKEIVGGIIRGNYRMEIGDTGYMYPIYDSDVSGMVMKIPNKNRYGKGIVCQFNGNERTQAAGDFSYYPYGLYIYRCDYGWNKVDNNDSYILHVDGFVNARGVGGIRFTKDNDGDNDLWCIGSYQSVHSSVRLQFGGGGNDIYYQSSDLRCSLWKAITNALSDVRYKTNIKKSDVNCLDIVNNINFYSFDWAKGKDPCKKKEPFKVGMIAQEVESIDKDFVYDNDGVKFVDTYRMLNVALKAIQELSFKVARLESELEGKGA